MLPQNEAGKTSDDDIATLLINPAKATPDQSGDVGEEVAPEQEQDENEETSPDQSGQEEEEEVSTDADEDQQDEEEDGDADGFVSIDDEDTLEVLVDGEMVEMTIKQLKKAASGEGAIEKRLQQTTEKLKEATALHGKRTQAIEALAQEERDLQETLTDLEETLFKPLISAAPNAALKQSDPQRFKRLQDAYDKDQQRITSAKQAVAEKLQDVKQRRAARLVAYSEDAAKTIVQLIPELGDKDKAPTVLDTLRKTAASYGYTDAEMASALDPRMFHLIRDAMAYKQLIGKNKETTMKAADVKAKVASQPRRLRSGGLKNMKVSDQKAHQQVRAKAKSTGKVNDVAALIMKPS